MTASLSSFLFSIGAGLFIVIIPITIALTIVGTSDRTARF